MQHNFTEIAREFVKRNFPQCSAAFLAGSRIQGKFNLASDLDIVVFDDSQPAVFRESYRESGWVLDVFVLNRMVYRRFFDEGVAAAIPSLQRMCSAGVVIHDDGLAESIIRESREDLGYGPMPWSTGEIDRHRYEITEYLEDLRGGDRRDENVFTVNKLAVSAAEFALRTKSQWIGDGKWLFRCLESFDKRLAETFAAALDAFFRHDEKEPLIEVVTQLLSPYGGLLLDGFREEDSGEDE